MVSTFTHDVRVGQVWRFKATLEEQIIEKVDDRRVWVRSWATLNGFGELTFRELYEFVRDASD